MKLTLEFTDEEEHEYRCALNGAKAHYALKELDDHLRSKIKYGNQLELQPVRDFLHGLLQDYNLDIEG